MEEPRKRLLTYVMDSSDKTTGKVSAVGVKEVLEFDLLNDLPRVALIWNDLDEVERHVVCTGHKVAITQNSGQEREAANKMAVAIKSHKQIFVDRVLKVRSAAEPAVKVNALAEAAKAAGIPEELFQAMMEKLVPVKK